VMDHVVSAADGYMNKNLRGSYDPLVIGCVEGLVMLGISLVAYVALCKLQYFSHSEWTARAGWKGLLGVSVLIGAHGVLWALSSRGVQRQYEEAMTVIPVPLVLAVRFAWYEAFHIFHIAGALYASIGLLCTAYSTEELLSPTISDIYYIFQQVVWGLFLLSLAHWLGHNKRIPVFGLMVVFLAVQVACSTIGMVSLLGSGNIDSEAVMCLLFGSGCENAVPATLLAHAFASLLQLLSVVVVVKYVGAPITVVTLAASTCLRFYTHASPSSSVEVGAACVSVIGCAVFIHAQWMLEVSHNEEWQDELRRSAASTSMMESTSSDDDGGDGMGPLMMHD
jgi:general stress protein CsbA